MFTLISNGLLEVPSQLLMLRTILSLPAVQDPRTVDSPIFFLLISTAIAKSEVESPNSLCASLLNRVPNGEYLSTDIIAVSRNIELLKNDSNISITQCFYTAYSGYNKNEHHLTRGVAYVASWLDYQLDAPASARMTSLIAGDFACGINKILATTLQHSSTTGNISMYIIIYLCSIILMIIIIAVINIIIVIVVIVIMIIVIIVIVNISQFMI
jgi:hypothetical protein